MLSIPMPIPMPTPTQSSQTPGSRNVATTGPWRRLLPATFVLLGACTFHWEPAFNEVAAPRTFADVAIADLHDALTFARIEHEGVPRVVAVRSYQNDTITGVDLSVVLPAAATNPVQLFREHGYEALEAMIRGAGPGAAVMVKARDLVAPLDLRDEHIAAGTNFPEHAGEAGVEGGPFLFPKHVRPTGPYAPVAAGTRLLDYEVELAFVPLAPLERGGATSSMGLILCNDYTDRETLLRHADPWNVESGQGFTTGKSFPGALPVGNLFVIPRDLSSFTAQVELRLYVNGALRQRAPASAMIWSIDEIIAQTWARSTLSWDHRGRQVSLLGEESVIADDVLILAGTPHGTIFAGIDARQKVLGLGRWAFGGWRRSIPEHVIDRYIEDARAAGIYLKAGDEVVIHVARLGLIANRITP